MNRKEKQQTKDKASIRQLLQQNQTSLDRMQVTMATAREFLIIIRLRKEKESEVQPYLSRIEKSLKEKDLQQKRRPNRTSSVCGAFTTSRM